MGMVAKNPNVSQRMNDGMGGQMHEAEVTWMADEVEDALRELDEQIAGIAERSHVAEKMALQRGETVQEHGPRVIVGEQFIEQAEDARRRAQASIDRSVDKLVSSAKRHTSKLDATSTQIENIEFALSRGDLTDAELLSLYDEYKNTWSIERVLRAEARKRGISIEADAATTVLENERAIRDRTKMAANGRYYTRDRDGRAITPPSVLAASALYAARGRDALGGPLTPTRSKSEVKGAAVAAFSELLNQLS